MVYLFLQTSVVLLHSLSCGCLRSVLHCHVRGIFTSARSWTKLNILYNILLIVMALTFMLNSAQYHTTGSRWSLESRSSPKLTGYSFCGGCVVLNNCLGHPSKRLKFAFVLQLQWKSTTILTSAHTHFKTFYIPFNTLHDHVNHEFLPYIVHK